MAWVVRWQAVVGVRDTRVADSHFLAPTERWVAEGAEVGHGVGVVVASEVDDAVGAIGGWVDYELAGYGDAVRRALRAHDASALPAVVLSKQEREVPAAYRAGCNVRVGLPRRQHQIALAPIGPRWLRCGRRVEDDGVGAGARVRAAGGPHA
jgi:hypothetical protein